MINPRWKFTALVVVLPATMSCAALSACSSSEDPDRPAPPIDAGLASTADVLVGDAGPDDSDVVDASIDRRLPRDAGDAPPESIVHDVWAGTEVTCARVERAGTTATDCWGNNRFGQLGRGEIATTNGDAFVPQPVQWPTASDIVQVSVDGPACARSADKALRCWSRGFGFNEPVTSTPPDAPLLTGVEDVQVGGNLACVLRSNSHVACWGRNWNGQLGLGYSDNAVHSAPEEIPNFTAEQISVGVDHVCALEQGEVWCWGSNSSGAISEVVPRFSNSLSPARVPNVSGVTRVVAGRYFTCALTTDKTVWCWGDLPQASNVWGGSPVHMLEVGFDFDDPEPDQLLGDVEELAASDGICARITGGRVKCLGTNGAYVGYPDWEHYRQTRRFTTVIGIEHATHIVAGFDHVCALDESSHLRCWGGNGQGQLGIDPAIKERSGLPELVKF